MTGTSPCTVSAGRKRGLTVGPKAGLEFRGLEFRQMTGWHCDMAVAGPMSGGQMVDSATTP